MPDSQYGLTAAGFKLKRLREILNELQEKMSTVTDPDTGETLEVDFNEDDPFIQFLNIVCDELSAIWELMNAAYNQFDPMKATGPMLSSLVQLNGIRRKEGRPSTVSMTFIGTPGVFIPAGTIVADTDETMAWTTSEGTTIQQDGETLVLCDSVENGAFSYEAGKINVLVSQIEGVFSVVNRVASVVGQANESDIALRRRREKSTETPSQGLAESIYGSLASLEGVLYCKVFTNRTMETNENGIPRKSIAIVVQVEDKNDNELKAQIGSNIFLRSGLGEEYYNLGDRTGLADYVSQEVDFIDSFRQLTKVRFIYPQEIPIYVQVRVSSLEGSLLPNNFEEQIKNNILLFAKQGVQGLGIQLDSANLFDSYGFPSSEDIVASRLYTPVNAVKGCKINSLLIGTSSGTLSTNDIPVSWYEVGTFDANNIEVIREDENGD